MTLWLSDLAREARERDYVRRVAEAAERSYRKCPTIAVAIPGTNACRNVPWEELTEEDQEAERDHIRRGFFGAGAVRIVGRYP